LTSNTPAAQQSQAHARRRVSALSAQQPGAAGHRAQSGQASHPRCPPPRRPPAPRAGAAGGDASAHMRVAHAAA
jgi:hypothetical protein